jgi:hypothetical protein
MSISRGNQVGKILTHYLLPIDIINYRDSITLRFPNRQSLDLLFGYSQLGHLG